MTKIILHYLNGRQFKIDPHDGWNSFKQNLAGQTIVMLRSGKERPVRESLRDVIDIIHEADKNVEN